MVKPLHPIDEIAARIIDVDGEGVRLTHVLADDSSADVQAAGAQLNGTQVFIDPVDAIVKALAEPIDFPPLVAGIVPGDRVAIAVDEAVPQIGPIVRGAVQVLENAGIERQDISIVTADARTSQLCRDELSAGKTELQFIVHDPADDNSLCLVGTTKRGEPLLVNRAIFDADLVLPIGCARIGSESAYDTLFPRFSNAETLNEYRSPAQHETIAVRNRKRNEVDEAGWMIGSPLTVQVVPGPGETVRRVLAGEPQAVACVSDEFCEQQWLLQSPQRVSLLVATITGGPSAQTWANVGRVLEAAEELVEEGGAIAICSNLEEQLGPSLGRLVGSPDLDRAIRKISHDHEADSWPAWHLARALQRGPVFLLSQLDEETVEDLGLAPVENIEQMARLAGRHESFAIVNDSQHAVVLIEGEDGETE